MAAQAIENRARVSGVVRSVAPHPELRDQVVVTLDVGAIDRVGEYPNLFADAGDAPLDVIVPSEYAAAHQISAGSTIEWRIKKAGPGRAVLVPDLPKKD